MTAGGICEVIFSIVRGHEVNEGFLVTGLLFPLTLPPNIPLWQVALGIMFGVVVGKEIFGGTGRNFVDPALYGARVFVLCLCCEISGDYVWTAAKYVKTGVVDGFSGATALGRRWYIPERMRQRDKSPMESLQPISTTGGEVSISWWSPFWERFTALWAKQVLWLSDWSGHTYCDRDWILADYGWRVPWCSRIFLIAIHRRQRNQSDVFRPAMVAFRAGRFRLWHGIHGDRSGERIDDGRLESGFMGTDWRDDHLDSRD